MMRRVSVSAVAPLVSGGSRSYSSSTGAPAGSNAGIQGEYHSTCVDIDRGIEYKRPSWRHEVKPHAAGKSYLNTMYRWGYNSLALHTGLNESAGHWWNSNESSMPNSRWAEAGENIVANFWSGVQRLHTGQAQCNLRPGHVRAETYSNRKSKNGEVRVNYEELVQDKPQRLQMPQMPEHVKHNRVKHPLNGNEVIDNIQGKRVLREIQYQIGHARRFYMFDGVFGSHSATATPFRILCDNPVHAYFASIAAIRSKLVFSEEELPLAKRIGEDPFDEYMWRRPGVNVFSGTSYDFEVPRIVEEFGGPRPQDLGLSTNRFTLLDPYTIPMRSVIGAEPSCDHLLDQIALLSGRWGYYADDLGQLTLAADSAIDPKTGKLTLLVGASGKDANSLRSSKYLYGARYHRLADGLVSRGFDATSFKEEPSGSAAARKYDLVEDSLSTVQRPLPLNVGDDAANISHRFNKRTRRVGDYGNKGRYTAGADAKTQALASGHLFSDANKKAAASTNALARPSAFSIENVNVVVVGKGTGKDAAAAAKAIVSGLSSNNMLYADEEALTKSFTSALEKASSIQVVDAAQAAEITGKLAKSGAV